MSELAARERQSVAQVIHTHLCPHERVLHPDDDGASVLRLGGSLKQLVKRLPQLLEHGAGAVGGETANVDWFSVVSADHGCAVTIRSGRIPMQLHLLPL